MTTNGPGKEVFDATAAAVGLASFLQYLPSIAAFLSIVWFVIRIVESKTVQKMLGRYAWLTGDTSNDTSED